MYAFILVMRQERHRSIGLLVQILVTCPNFDYLPLIFLGSFLVFLLPVWPLFPQALCRRNSFTPIQSPNGSICQEFLLNALSLYF